jgi:hypothetical protein
MFYKCLSGKRFNGQRLEAGSSGRNKRHNELGESVMAWTKIMTLEKKEVNFRILLTGFDD